MDNQNDIHTAHNNDHSNTNGGLIRLMENVDFDNFQCSEPFRNRMGGNSVRVLYNNERRFFFQTPSMPLPFGISEFVPKDGWGVKYSLDLSFRFMDEDPKVQKFFAAMRKLDELMITRAVQHSVKWFGKALSEPVVRELYRPLVKQSSQPEKYKPVIKGKFREHPKDVMAETLDGDKFTVDKLLPGAKVKVIMELMPIWFMNKQFGLSLSVWRVLVTELPSFQNCRDNAFLTGFSFIKDDADDAMSDTDIVPVPRHS